MLFLSSKLLLHSLSKSQSHRVYCEKAWPGLFYGPRSGGVATRTDHFISQSNQLQSRTGFPGLVIHSSGEPVRQCWKVRVGPGRSLIRLLRKRPNSSLVRLPSASANIDWPQPLCMFLVIAF